MPHLVLPPNLDIFTRKKAGLFVMQHRSSHSEAAAIFEFTPMIIPRPEDATETYHVAEPTEWYRRKTNEAVFRAQLVRGSAPEPAQDVVCKILPAPESPEDLNDDGLSSLQQEALIYQEKLGYLQGICVPRFIGLFGWTAPNGAEGFECLIITWEGYSPSTNPHRHDVAYRSRILDALLAIHRAGVRHYDLESIPNNMLIKDNGDVFFIDFEESTEHQCELPKDYRFLFHTPMPTLKECPCLELKGVARQLGVWYPPKYSLWGGYTAPTVEILKGRKSLMNYLRNRGEGLTEEDIEYGANRAIEWFQEWIDYRKLCDGDVPLSIVSD
ncbi:hypothetical protein C8Q78DRAFT_558118 [Trametes maxima]|nr:hypothetical protein C8Q78DRAFT_558118 [Trametes maxima]